MIKNYFFILFFAFTILLPLQGVSQDDINVASIEQNSQELTIYPNPVTNGQTLIFINSKLNLSKQVDFYNVLGKRIFTSIITGKELNIGNISKGVYILKITEKGVTHIRKLILK